MQRLVGEHIRNLEERVKLLALKLMENNRTLKERNEIEAEMRAANSALDHFKAALDLEKKLSPD